MIQFESETDVKITETDLTLFETTTGFSFPGDYKTHMLKFNGGVAEDDAYFTIGDDEYELEYFFPFRGDEDDDITIEDSYGDDADRLPDKHLTIGTIEGGYLCMDCSGAGNGTVFIYFEDLVLIKVANSFSDFINGLSE